MEYVKDGETVVTRPSFGGVKATLDIAATDLLTPGLVDTYNKYDTESLPFWPRQSFTDLITADNSRQLSGLLAPHADNLENLYVDLEFTGLILLSIQLSFRDKQDVEHNIFAEGSAVESTIFKNLMESPSTTKYFFHAANDLRVLRNYNIDLARETYVDLRGQPTTEEENALLLPQYTSQRSLVHLVRNTLGHRLVHDKQVHAGFAKHVPGTPFTVQQIEDAVQDAVMLRLVHERLTDFRPKAEPKVAVQPPFSVHTVFPVTIEASNGMGRFTMNICWWMQLKRVFEYDRQRSRNDNTICDYLRTDNVEDKMVYQEITDGGCRRGMRFRRVPKRVTYLLLHNGDVEADEDLTWHGVYCEHWDERERCYCPVVCQWPRCTACHMYGGRQTGLCACFRLYAEHTDTCAAKHRQALVDRTSSWYFETNEDFELWMDRRFERMKARYERRVERRHRRDISRSCMCLLKDNHAFCSASAPNSEDDSSSAGGD